MRYLTVILAVLALTACENPTRNLYEGIKANNEAKRTPNERAMTPAPGYDQYQKERDSQSAE